MSSVFDGTIKRKEETEKEEKVIKRKFEDIPEYNTPEYKKLVEEADEKIRQDRIRQAKAVRKSKDYFAL